MTDHCEHCGAQVSNYRNGCPGCGAPQCCQSCCNKQNARDSATQPTERDRERALALSKEFALASKRGRAVIAIEGALAEARAEGAREKLEALMEIVESTFPPVIAREFAADLRAREKEKAGG